MHLYDLTIAIPFNDNPQIVKMWCIFEVAIFGQNKKVATTALKSVPRLPLYLLKQLFFTYIVPFLYEIRGLYDRL